jgi:hypothetical protein
VDAKGMVIYNSNASLPSGAGLYAWNGSEWKSMNAGNADSCVPVTATATSTKTENNAKITVNVTAGNPTFSYIWSKDGTPVRTTSNVSATSDTYTTVGEGIYTVTITNPCMATPIRFTFEVSGSGETLVDNGNGTKTDSQGNLVYNGETYALVKSDVPGIYLDEAGEIVYTGADGIPGTEDDDVFAIPDYPLPTQKTLFSVKYPITLHPREEYQMELDFADGHIYPGIGAEAYTGKIKFISNDPNIVIVNETGIMTAGATINTSTIVTIILEDGSIAFLNPTYIRAKSVASGDKLAGLIDAETTFIKGSVGKIRSGLIARSGGGNPLNIATLTYAITDDSDDTGSTITSGGWFHAGDLGHVTVTATATDDDGETFTGTITVTVREEFPEETPPYETASSGWATLEPAPAYAGGDGTETSPYQISSVRQFKKLATDIVLLGSTEATYQKYFELTTDLDFSEDKTVTSTLIGTFYGTFDGKGHVIRDLHIDATGKSGVSLFNSLIYGEIKNLGREGGSTTGDDAVSVAGLVLTIRNGKLSNCYNSSSINVLRGAGGLAHDLYGGSIIQNCYNTGEINSLGGSSGGITVSGLWEGGSVNIINSYNTGNISNSYNSGSISGNFNYANGRKQILNLNNFFNFGNITNSSDNNGTGSIVGNFSTNTEVNATNVYSRPDVVSINGIIKSNQPIGWDTPTRETWKNAVLAANPTLGENEKYTLEYSKTSAFATELGDAFKYAPGRMPKLAWEK